MTSKEEQFASGSGSRGKRMSIYRENGENGDGNCPNGGACADYG